MGLGRLSKNAILIERKTCAHILKLLGGSRS